MPPLTLCDAFILLSLTYLRLAIHPGGRDIFLSPSLLNRDITDLYHAVHSESLSADGWLSSYHIGHLTMKIVPSLPIPPSHALFTEDQVSMCPFAKKILTPDEKYGSSRLFVPVQNQRTQADPSIFSRMYDSARSMLGLLN